MQHKFPFCVLHFEIDAGQIDVNVHPTKMDVRIANGPAFYDTVKDVIHKTLHETEMIPEVVLTADKSKKTDNAGTKVSVPEPFERRRIAQSADLSSYNQIVLSSHSEYNRVRQFSDYGEASRNITADIGHTVTMTTTDNSSAVLDADGNVTVPTGDTVTKPAQMNLFEDKILSEQARAHYEIIGQLFDTYWLVSYGDKLLIIDQHAAHEKVKYERLIKRFREHDIVFQTVNPPLIVTLSGRELECYLKHAEDFKSLGFIIEEFGGNDYAIRGVPLDLYGYGEKGFFREILEELADDTLSGTPESVRVRLASMACKAAVKGNMKFSVQEAEKLIEELLMLENPYHCPHGRPTIISMTKYELEKKFKRIVT